MWSRLGTHSNQRTGVDAAPHASPHRSISVRVPTGLHDLHQLRREAQERNGCPLARLQRDQGVANQLLQPQTRMRLNPPAPLFPVASGITDLKDVRVELLRCWQVDATGSVVYKRPTLGGRWTSMPSSSRVPWKRSGHHWMGVTVGRCPDAPIHLKAQAIDVFVTFWDPISNGGDHRRPEGRCRVLPSSAFNPASPTSARTD